MSCEVAARLAGRQVIVEFRGELDAPGAVQALAASGVQMSPGEFVIFDLAALQFIDCFALRALLEIRQMAQRAGGDVLLAAPGQRIQRVLTLTGYAHRFCIYPTVTAAVASMRG
jgi:anti-sigma B factor antagonist